MNHQTTHSPHRPYETPLLATSARTPTSQGKVTTLSGDSGELLPPRFRIRDSGNDDIPLVLSDHAFLYVATGNDTPEYAEKYGTDSIVLHYMHSAQSLVFTRSVDSARKVEEQGQRAIQRFNELNQRAYGLPLPEVYDQHEFVIWSGEPNPSPSGVAQAARETWQLAHHRGRNSDRFTQLIGNARFNQFTAIQLRHIIEVIEFHNGGSNAHTITPADISRLERVANQAIMLNNKAAYFEITQNSCGDLPRHVATNVMLASEVYSLMGTQDLLTRLREKIGTTSGEIVIKSAVEAGGECCVVLRGEGDNMRLAELFRDLRKKGRDLGKTPCLIQRCVTPPESGLPARIGILGYVGDHEYVEATTQVYSDPDRRTYLGSYWSAGTAQAALASIGIDKVNNLLDVFKSTGYVGPLGLDAMLDADGDYTLIYDANPRLTSAAAVLMVRDALQKAGVPITAAVSLGHHGNWEFTDVASLMDYLSSEDLAFTASSGRGVLITPNPRGQFRFDVYCINMNNSEILAAFGALVDLSSEAPEGLFF